MNPRDSQSLQKNKRMLLSGEPPFSANRARSGCILCSFAREKNTSAVALRAGLGASLSEVCTVVSKLCVSVAVTGGRRNQIPNFTDLTYA